MVSNLSTGSGVSDDRSLDSKAVVSIRKRAWSALRWLHAEKAA
jgi:hypothetical protein